MEFRHYTDEDTIFIRLRSGQSSETKELDENRYVGVNDDGDIVWVSLLNVSEGVDLDMLEGRDLQEASNFVEASDLRTLV